MCAGSTGELMREDIRKRIEAVRRGEVPEGYIVENHQLHPMAWKYEKIGKYLVAYDEYSNDTKRYMLATSSRQGLVPQTDYYNDQRFDETMGGFHVVPEGYVTYRHMSDDDIFKFNVNNLGAPVLVSPEYPVFTTRAELNQSLFIEYLNGANEFRTFCRAQKKGSTRTRMYFSRLGEFMMPIPPISEQEKIADILAACDRVIDLKQKRVEELKQLKKTCLAKMFPKGNADVPELRFPGFTDPWEQRKVSDMFKVTRGYVLAATLTAENQSETMPFPVYSSQTKDNGLMGFYKDYLYEDAITWTTDGANAGTVNYRAGKFYCTNVCGVLLSDKINANQMVAEALNNVAKGYVSYVGNPKLMNNVMADIEIMIPSKQEERDQISNFLGYLDRLITLHQRELEAERQKKKALMKLLLKGLVRVNA